MCLAIRIDESTAIFIMSEHKLFNNFLFEQLEKSLPLDHQSIIDASLCKENHIFLLYEKQ